MSTKTEIRRIFQSIERFEMGRMNSKMGWPTCTIGQPKVGTLDKTVSSVALKLAMVKVSKGVISRCTFYCHSYFLEMS